MTLGAIDRTETAAAPAPNGPPQEYWSADADTLVQQLGSAPGGLSIADAAKRLREYGPNQVREHDRLTRTRVLVNQIRNPLLLVLVFAAVASAMTGEWVDAVIVVVIVLATVSIGYTREYQAETAAAALQARVRTRARVLRDGHAVRSARSKRSCRATSCCCRPAAWFPPTA